MRYTSKPAHMPADMRVKKNAIDITFTDAIDTATATDLANYSVEQWQANKSWTSNYGSPEFSVANPDKKGHDKVEVQSAKLSADGKTLTLEIPGLQPVMQMRIKYNLKTKDGSAMASDIDNMINKYRRAEERLRSRQSSALVSCNSPTLTRLFNEMLSLPCRRDKRRKPHHSSICISLA